eukprot:1221394-Prymnesium_polylepis.1
MQCERRAAGDEQRRAAQREAAQLDARRAGAQLEEARGGAGRGAGAHDGVARSDEADGAGERGGVKDKGLDGVGAAGELELCRQAARRVGAEQVEGGGE